MKDKPIDWEQNYNGIVELEKQHRLTIAHKDRVIAAYKIENKMLRRSLKEECERKGICGERWMNHGSPFLNE
jgi:hypothetical protein